MTEHVQDVDVVVMGAGGAAYPGAFLLDHADRRVVMADPIGNLGGDCLAEGCIPSKAVREASLVRASYPLCLLRPRRDGAAGLVARSALAQGPCPEGPLLPTHRRARCVRHQFPHRDSARG